MIDNVLAEIGENQQKMAGQVVLMEMGMGRYGTQGRGD
jgi:hypothetical protein